jgi:vacuolar-type H+-ATPase subunit E/Vma4
MPGLSEAVLGKVRSEADAILRQAREEAGRMVEEARRQRQNRIEAESTRLVADAEADAARIIAQGRMEARQKLARAKAGIIEDIVRRAEAALKTEPPTEASFARLVHDALDGLAGAGKVILHVGPAELGMARELVAMDARLAKLVIEVAEGPSGGGVLIETENGSRAVDNRYATRLEMLVPRILPRFGHELFQGRLP